MKSFSSVFSFMFLCDPFLVINLNWFAGMKFKIRRFLLSLDGAELQIIIEIAHNSSAMLLFVKKKILYFSFVVCYFPSISHGINFYGLLPAIWKKILVFSFNNKSTIQHISLMFITILWLEFATNKSWCNTNSTVFHFMEIVSL